MDNSGNRKVCIPIRPGFKCRKLALLVRVEMNTKNEFKKMQRSVEKERRLAVGKQHAIDLSIAFINSNEGIKFFMAESKAAAKADMVFLKAARKKKKSRLKRVQKKNSKQNKVEHKIAKLEKQRDHRKQHFESRLVKLEESLQACHALGDVSQKLKLEADIIDAQAELESHVEDTLIEELREDNKDLFGSDSDSTSSISEDDSVHSDSDIDDEEPAVEVKKGAAWKLTHELHERRRKEFKVRRFELVQNFPKKNPIFEELCATHEALLKEHYEEDLTTKAEGKVLYEFEVLEWVMKMWMGLGVKRTFVAWRDWFRNRRDARAGLKQKEIVLKDLKEKDIIAAHELMLFDASKWVQKMDVFNDKVYWRNSDSGETSWSPPEGWDILHPEKGQAGESTLHVPEAEPLRLPSLQVPHSS
jgi:hypothetical protein